MSDTTDRSRYDNRDFVFDPVRQPELFDDVRRRRIFAFLLDVVAIAALTFVTGVAVFVLGLLTFGLGWLIYAFLWQAVALLYTAFTLGGPNSATPGMRAMGLEMRLWDGAPMYPLLAAVHALGYWLSVVFLTPFVLLVSLISDRKRLLHDMLLGTVVINSPGDAEYGRFGRFER
ncbi:RDD family protein [Rhodobium gokarnense]|uniref:RDD family membrane protein YckC n=1 Tax=Rhodobium gokarnense TaxID=364296 RepID=A0ABT3HG03_9HYPH|nr:RDD family protein [Rhodobium gokarnense]MCW2309332.1 putative RDD family membrane protein YckC [Rhodobium gokarnense]